MNGERRRRRTRLVAPRVLALLGCGLVASCGAKSSLPGPGDGDGRTGRPGGVGRGGRRDDGAGGREDRPDPPCSLVAAGEPIVAADFPEGNANTPFVVATRSGEEGTAAIVLQAISQDANFWHPELRLSRWSIGAAWPSEATLDQGFALAGTDAHAGGRIGFTPGSRVGVAWFRGDEAAGLPTGLKFRPVEPDAWAFGEEVFVDPQGETVYAIAPERGSPESQWAIVYRGALADLSIETRLAVVRSTGELVGEPIVLAGAREYPGIAADVIHAGDGWLAAVSFGVCVADDPACDAAAVVVAAVTPGDASPIAPRASFPVATPGDLPRRASFARDGDLVWLAWSEGPASDDAAPRRIVLAALDEEGGIAVPAHAIAEGVVISVGLQVSGGPDGPIVTWGEAGDPSIPPEQVGAATYVVHHERVSGPAQATRFATTAFAYGAGSPAAELADPRGAVVAWAASLPGQLRTGVMLARLDCR